MKKSPPLILRPEEIQRMLDRGELFEAKVKVLEKGRRVRLPMLPEMRCDDGCGDCCGPAKITAEERDKIAAFIREKKIIPRDNADRCPFYQMGTCAIYEVRPMICKIFGYSRAPELTCSRGYNRNVLELAQVRELLRQNGEHVFWIHGFLSPRHAEMAEAYVTGALTSSCR